MTSFCIDIEIAVEDVPIKNTLNEHEKEEIERVKKNFNLHKHLTHYLNDNWESVFELVGEDFERGVSNAKITKNNHLTFKLKKPENDSENIFRISYVKDLIKNSDFGFGAWSKDSGTNFWKVSTTDGIDVFILYPNPRKTIVKKCISTPRKRSPSPKRKKIIRRKKQFVR